MVVRPIYLLFLYNFYENRENIIFLYFMWYIKICFYIVIICISFTVEINSDNYVQIRIGPYIAGLIERDGNIYVPSSNRSKKTGKTNYPSISIRFCIEDLPLAYKIQSQLGYGRIFESKISNYVTISFYSKERILSIFHLINGHMRTPKQIRLVSLAHWYNNLDRSLNLVRFPVDTSSLSSNSWLSGFTDGDGNFSLHLANNRYYIGVYHLSQSRTDHGYINIFYTIIKIIRDLFSTTVNVRYITNPSGTVTLKMLVKTSSLVSGLAVCDYFTRFPLFSSKYINYLNYQTLVNMQKTNENKTARGIHKVKEIKKNHNRTRSSFTWDHLNNFYSK